MIPFETLEDTFFTLYDLEAMDTHPIPQNVTSFQFKLVGEMTLKQFLYLATGMIIAYVFFVFLASRIPYIAWPIIVISGATGAAFAFLPIGDRPLDHWLGAFLKAVYSPTKMSWKKNGNLYNQDAYFNNRLQVYIKNITPNINSTKNISLPPATQRSNQPIFKTEIVDTPQFMQQPVSASTGLMTTQTQTAPANLPTKDELAQTVELAKQAQSIQVQIIQSQRQLNDFKNITTQNPQDYQEQINQLLTNLQSLITEASGIKQKLDSLTHTATPPRTKVRVTTVIPVKPKPTQIILTTTPNVINGFVADALGNYLTNVVVVIYDKQGLPVRALKTNKLGQFSGATPLPNGTYTIQLEKDNLVFDVLQIDLTGEVLPALMIAAKKVL